MSYAIEAKKRKFDRILESLTDGADSQSRPSLNSRNNGSTVSLVNAPTPDSSKRRRFTPTSLLSASKTASTSSLTGHYLPSSRQAFLERLETYRQVTKWHVPSTSPINASTWVKRGWICVDTDTVFCGSCKERLYIDLEVKDRAQTLEDPESPDRDEAEDYSLQKEVYEGLVKRYQDLVVTAHAESCPWRKRGCDASIQRIEGLLNMNNAISGLQTRYEGLLAEDVPGVSPLPSNETHELELDTLRLEGKGEMHKDPLRLAACGWRRKSEDVIECQYCFRSLGLWLYRGSKPTMEQLDPIESHLEYCPWISPEAQDTEVSIASTPGSEVAQRKERITGFALVCQAVAKHNAKGGGTKGHGPDTVRPEDSRPNTSESMTPEQRVKKRLDLFRRIKDLKKPFKAKFLLRKKEKA